jgi:ribosomal protein L12E/L44/L45/RPP1/RPP2
MSTALTDEEKLKSLFKAALIEVLDERWDLVREALEEVIEDVALTRDIDEASGGANVSREEVFKILEGEP